MQGYVLIRDITRSGNSTTIWYEHFGFYSFSSNVWVVDPNNGSKLDFNFFASRGYKVGQQKAKGPIMPLLKGTSWNAKPPKILSTTTWTGRRYKVMSMTRG